MTPQSKITVLAPIIPDERASLEQLLDGMNQKDAPGMADPGNAVVPFGDFDTIHYARFAIIDDRTLSDFELLGLDVPQHPLTLLFMVDCDGMADDMLRALANHPQAAAGLRSVFGHCEGFAATADLVGWMQAHDVKPAANYVNWRGRTVRQVHEEAQLRVKLNEELARHCDGNERALDDAREVHQHLRRYAAGMMPQAPAATPMAWFIRNALHLLIVPLVLALPWVIAWPWLQRPPTWTLLVLIVFVPLSVAAFVYLWRRTTLLLAVLAVQVLSLVALMLLFPVVILPVAAVVAVLVAILRWQEKAAPEIIPVDPNSVMDPHVERLAEREDHYVSNQFTVVGSVKPGLFWRWLSSVLLWLIDYGARHIFNRGHLGRIQTIHFASWTFIDDKKRLIFASNYDGSLEAYMDDFINKVGWGLNLAFGGGLGYPRVNWLILNGSKEEQKFKYTLRRHQLPTEVWYNAYPGLTAYDLARNGRVHAGLRRDRMSEKDIRAWLRDF